MERLSGNEEKLNQAFKLASFIHGERETAISIAMDATAKLEAAIAAQDKRLYYEAKSRKKVSLSEEHLLQRLVYLESEPYERAKEQASDHTAIDEGTLLVHFIKHLVRITMRRTSFYVTLGLSRVLHNYSTRETMEIYNIVVQDPGRVREDSYYRSRKGILIKELKKRFGDLLSIRNGPHNETRFEVQNDSSRYLDLIRRCLTQFTPWSTRCVIPEDFNPIEHELPHLSFHGSDPDEEHRTEVARMHAILHPSCYQHLINGLHQCQMSELSFDDPEQKLQIPRFNLSKNGDPDNGSRPDRKQPEELSEEELAALCRELAEQTARRKQWGTGLLRILVDGEERVRFDPRQTSEVSFRIEEGEELIEIYGQGKDYETLLAVQLLTSDDDSQEILPAAFILKLAGRQELAFTLTSIRDSKGASSYSQAEVTYREAHPAQAVLRWARQMKQQLAKAWRQWTGNVGTILVFPRALNPLITYSLASMLLLAVLGCSLLITKVLQLQGRIAQFQAPQTTLSGQQTTGGNGKAAQTEQLNLPVIPLALTTSLVRETGKIERLILPSSESQVALLLKLTANNYQSYQAIVVRVDEKTEILTQEIATDITIGGGKWVVLALPSSKLSIGDYQVKLRGAINNENFEDIGKYHFKVRSK